MSLSQYQAFLKTIELGNLTRAAEDLGYTQSGITHLLNALEDDCGLKLLVREKSGAYATSDGEMLIPYFEEICRSYDSLKSKLYAMRKLESGLVRIATFTSVSVQWLPGIIAAYVEDHPQVEFQLLQGTTEENMEWLKRGKVDCSFVSSIEGSSFPTFKLHSDPLVAVVPEGHELASQRTISVTDLARYPYIKLTEGTYTETKEIEDVFLRHNARPKVRFAEMNDYAVVAMVEKNLGVTLLPQMLVWKTTRKLAVRPLTSGEDRILGIAVKNIDQMNEATREFIKYAQRWVAQKYEG